MIGDLTQQSDALNALSVAASVALAIVALCASVTLVVLAVAKLFPDRSCDRPCDRPARMIPGLNHPDDQ